MSSTTPAPNSARSNPFNAVAARLQARFSDPAWQAAQDERAREGNKLFAADANRERRLHVENVMSTVGRRYERCDLDTFEVSTDPAVAPIQRRILERLRAFCAGVKAETDAGHGLVFFGPCGTGKDHLMVAALRAAAAAGISCRWVSGVDLYTTWRDDIGNEVDEHKAMKAWLKPTILAISDPQPPKDNLTAGQARKLYDLLDKRYRDGKPTWATINAKDANDASTKLTVPVVDRFKDKAHALGCYWPSYRRTL